MTPAELGESHTSSFISIVNGTSPKFRPSRRIIAHFRSWSHGTWSDGPMWMFSLLSGSSSCDWTDCVFETFFEVSRSRSSMFMKSMLPPKLSW